MSNPSAVKNPQLTRNVNVSNEKLSETHISTRKLRQEIRTLKSDLLKDTSILGEKSAGSN